MPVFLSLAEAVQALTEGKTLIFPTETFYGLGCNAFNPDAVGAVFAMKNRPLNTPLPVVIGAREDVARLSQEVSPTAERLMDLFWPGPLSVVLPALPAVPDLLTANAGRVAVRFSPHEAARELCRATGMVLVASSANISGDPPTADAAGLSPLLLKATAGIYMQGPAPEGGLPSTVVDVIEEGSGPVVRVLRPGAITAGDLQKAGFSVQDCVETH